MSARSIRRSSRREQARRLRRGRLAVGAVFGASSLGMLAAPSVLAANIEVQNTNPSGTGSLAAAVTQANADQALDTITFAPSVTGTIHLNASLNLNYSTTIDGPGSGVLTVDNSAAGTTFVLKSTGASTAVDTIEGLTITGSKSGAIRDTSHVGSTTVQNCSISGQSPTASSPGGAIYVNGVDAFNLTDSTVANSTSDGSGGGIFAKDTSLTISGSTVSGNKSVHSAGGGLFVGEGPTARHTTVTVADSTFSGNSSPGDGGGIAVENIDSDTTIERSSITGNHTASIGGGFYMAYGGALTVDSSTIADNIADFRAGGLFAYGPRAPFTMSDSTVAGNQAPSDAGISWWNLRNQPGTIANSTITGNTATTRGGGIYRVGQNALSTAGSDLTLSSTVVAANTAPVSPDINQATEAKGSIVVGNSFIGSTSGAGAISESPAGTNKLDGGDPGLSPLADNGGPTMTLLPMPTSPLIDAGVANGLTLDQRGLGRTVEQSAANASGSDGTDIGAVELADTTLDGANVNAKKKQKEKGKKIVIAVSAGASEAVTATADGTAKVGKRQIGLTVPPIPVAAGQTATLRLRPSNRKGTRKIAKRLASGKKVKAAINVTLTDAAANSEEHSVKVKLSEKGKKRH